MDDLIGRSLGPYHIVEKIGEGGMATIYKAYQPSLDRTVALKALPPVHAKQPGFSERFQREAKAVANLHHPNILPVYDYGREGEYGFIVMRYVEGARTLKEVMAESLELPQVVDLIGQIAAALDHAHQQGVVHRDVKPSNVLMDGVWALLSDFGLAKITEASVKLTGTGVGVGTPAYMSPEQGQGGAVDHRTDVYSLGVILFEMLTGQIPHNAETPFAIVLKRVTEPLPMPRAINPEIPKLVERVLLKALATNPDDRFQTAGELVTALKRAAEGEATESPTVIVPFRSTERPAVPVAGQKSSPSWKLWLGLAGGTGLALAALVICGVAVYGVVSGRSNTPTVPGVTVPAVSPTATKVPPIVAAASPTATSPLPTLTPTHTSTPKPTQTPTPKPPTDTPTLELPSVTERDLGTVHYSEAPKTWTIDVPQDFSKVEVAVYVKGKDETNKYGGWMAYLQINGEYAWQFSRFDQERGGIIQDYIKGEKVVESSGRGQYLNVTRMVRVGENTITYYHFTEGDGIGVRLRIHTSR